MRKLSPQEIKFFQEKSTEEMTDVNVCEMFDQELERAKSVMLKFLTKLKEKSPALEKLDPAFFQDVIELDLKKIDGFIQRATLDNSKLDFFDEKIMPFLSMLTSKIEFEVQARMEYLKLLKSVSGS